MEFHEGVPKQNRLNIKVLSFWQVFGITHIKEIHFLFIKMLGSNSKYR
jgi:hypothetical protein